MDFLELFLFYTFEKLIQSDEQNNLMNDILSRVHHDRLNLLCTLEDILLK